MSDADIGNGQAVETIRAALARHRPRGTPFLCLLRDTTLRSAIQAQAVGATEVLPADVPPSLLAKTITRLLQEGEGGEAASDAAAFTRSQLTVAAASLADMLGAASAGKPVTRGAVDASVRSIDEVAGAGNLGDLLQIVWNYDDLTYQHCMLVAGLAASFAHRLGFSAADRELVTRAAVLHDIGKARIPLEVLHKPGPLDEAEQAMVRTHPEIGHAMLLAQGGFAPVVLTAVRSHHEYLDGTGYPDGLSGAEIPDIVRIITICDIYAALIERRSYKAPMAPEAAFDILVQMGGKLDKDLLRAFEERIVKAHKAAQACATEQKPPQRAP
ncbi:hypothetical protein ASE63_13610 [Bosea sp. Root381]|uniref:HD-GYP domain-containing protein n=1 Tax=Bosea sp. Root381 TaxID=1736524 RepID=UPI0006FC08B4|nr:HD domain-containing phosphohydrolase [Bosea sp. Root381]KRE17481.1 hypothetical protein ASE63_13610 [Bosea sp. Root381]